MPTNHGQPIDELQVLRYERDMLATQMAERLSQELSQYVPPAAVIALLRARALRDLLAAAVPAADQGAC